MQSSNTCLICYDDQPKLINLSCKCRVCEECFQMHIKTNIQLLSYKQGKGIICPGICGNILDNNYILQIAQENQQFEKLNELLFYKYLMNAQDIRACPSQECNYYGIMPTTQCQAQLECGKCETKWKNPEIQFYNLNSLRVNSRLELLTVLHQYLYTKPCPNCNIGIQKNGGCYHMTCMKCSYEYCWDCNQEYKTHSINKCMMNYFIKNGIQANILFNLVIQFDYHQTLYHIFVEILKILYNFIIINSQLFLLLSLILILTNKLQEETHKSKLNQPALRNLGCLLALFYIQGQISIQEWIQYIMWELVCLLLGSVGLAFGQRVYKSLVKHWLKLVI